VTDRDFMQLALEEARIAATRGEVPVGAVLVFEERVLAAAGNRTIADRDPTAHAEINALRAGATAIGNHRLVGTSLYVTLEPCTMCAGALIQARVGRLVYGTDDPKGGAIRTCAHVLDTPALNHRVIVTMGVLAEESAGLLQTFFAARR
jgi:tRNA(adenine34) deaminase